MLAIAAATTFLAPAAAANTRPVDSPPLTDKQAAKRVKHSSWEPRPENARSSTAFNADYYGAIIRAYYDGKMQWLNTVERGREYRPGDLYGSLGAWFAGRWRTPPANSYIARVRQTLRDRTWRSRDF